MIQYKIQHLKKKILKIKSDLIYFAQKQQNKVEAHFEEKIIIYDYTIFESGMINIY